MVLGDRRGVGNGILTESLWKICRKRGCLERLKIAGGIFGLMRVTFGVAHLYNFVILRIGQPLTNLEKTSVDLTEIRKIMKLMDEHGLSQFQFEKEDFKLKLKKGSDFEDLQRVLGSLPSGGMSTAPAPALPGAVPALEAAGPVASGEEITSPMVGTFYRKPSPDDPDFIKIGDVISEGQTLCIIEAMKVMNEIKAERSGTITEICVNDGTPVQYGDALFRVK